MEQSAYWWNLPIYGGTPRDWLVALGLSAALLLAVYLLKPIIARRLETISRRSSTRLDDAVLAALGATRFWLVAVFAASIGSRYLSLPEDHEKLLGTVTALAFFLQAGLWIGTLFKFWIANSQRRALEQNPGAATNLAALSFIGQIALWSVILLLALDNMGVNITALVAGLGVGGVAVALAVQNILGDLFASLSIVVDKPFVIGDFIIIENYMGTVEYVGLKTTRIRSLDGEQIIFSNSDLLKSRVRNYKRMYERRVVFAFRLVYETNADCVELVPRLVREAIEAQQQVRFDRSHFAKFGEQSLEFETVYWVLSPDYNLYMDIHQAIMLQLMREFDRRRILFAIPRQMTRFEQPIRVQVEHLPGDPPNDGGDRDRGAAEPRDAH